MNPEFRRNVWLELTLRRLTTMTAVLLLIFFAASLSDSDWPLAAAAKMFYYFIVVVWGARNAALSVVGEIRDRTWDSQRLSSLDAGQMFWGKLFGSTIFNWYGGALCLAVLITERFAHQGLLAGLIDLVYFVGIGLIAQSVALLASLVAALRRQTHSRLDVFLYQAAGLAAAIVVYRVWQAADPAAVRSLSANFIPWWGHPFEARGFLLASLAVFAAWTLMGCYREMRIELKIRNGPFVWLALLLFIGVYVAGFDAWLPDYWTIGAFDAVTLRLALAAATYAILTYAMVLLEPKDIVLYRWLANEVARRRIAATVSRMQGWMMSYLAAFAVVAALVVWLLLQGRAPAAALVISTLGFVTRDVAIFVLLQTLPGPRRGDFAAIVVLFALYVLAPAIAHGLGLKPATVLFYPQAGAMGWLSPVIAWAQAATLVSVAFRGMARGARSAAAAA
jgi:hypothetical protein